MTNFWVSWYCPADLWGKFELHSPWWVSGERADGAYTICAALKAKNADQAKLLVIMAHDAQVLGRVSADGGLEWRFASPQTEDWSPFSDRFERADWMKWPQETANSDADLKECDCCGKMKPDVKSVHVSYAGDASACDDCRGMNT